MKLKNYHIFSLSLMLFVLLTTCNQDEPTPEKEETTCNEPASAPPAQLNLWACHRTVTRDSTATESALLGVWTWEYISCFWKTEKANGEDFKCLSIEFKADHTLIVKESGKITQTARWKIFRGDPELFVIKTEPLVPQVVGRILFCEDVLEFNDSYVDGCDNYFKKGK
jgi:hypothetical protein